jgi:hypothetical protein
VSAPSGAFSHDMSTVPLHEPLPELKMAAETVEAVGMDTCMSYTP